MSDCPQSHLEPTDEWERKAGFRQPFMLKGQSLRLHSGLATLVLHTLFSCHASLSGILRTPCFLSPLALCTGCSLCQGHCLLPQSLRSLINSSLVYYCLLHKALLHIPKPGQVLPLGALTATCPIPPQDSDLPPQGPEHRLVFPPAYKPCKG